MRKKILLCFLFLSFLIGVGYAQDTATEGAESTAYIQGATLYDTEILNFFEGMRTFGFAQWRVFIYDAQAISCIFMLIFFAIKSYEMMAGDKQLEIMPLLRPFLLLMIIMWWGMFCKIVAYPTDLIAMKTKALFESQIDEIDALRLERAGLMVQVGEELLLIRASAEIAKEEAQEANKSWGAQAVDGVTGFFADNVYNPIVKFALRMQTGAQLLLTQLLEQIAQWILRMAVYLVFLLQIIYSTILIILGPFSVAVSILPAYRDSFTTWVARFISVNLYVGVAWLVLYVSGMLMLFAMQQEVNRYKFLVDGADGKAVEKLTWLAMNGVMSFGMVIVTAVVGAIAITTVPSISTWIVSSSGITSAASTSARAAGAMGGMAGRLMTNKGGKG